MHNGALKVNGNYFNPRQHDAGNQTTIESGEESARRLQQGFLSERLCGEICQRQKSELRWRNQNKILSGWREFQFLHLQIEFCFLFGLFSGGDGFAHFARMVAVESFFHGGLKRTRMKIIREHRRPRDCLQQRPMRAEHRREREDEENFAKPLEHANKLNCHLKNASA